MDHSLEAQFHRRIKLLPNVNKRMQGYLMGEFRRTVPKELDAAVHAMWEANQNTANAIEQLLKLKEELKDAKLQNSILLGRLNNRCEKITVLEAALVQAQQARQQSRKASLAETLTNTGIGFAGSLYLTWVSMAAISNTGLAVTTATVACTVWSIVRGYMVRRFFSARLA